jgi:hypothetical protein
MKSRPAQIVALLAVIGVALVVTYKVVDARWASASVLEARQVVERSAASLELKLGDFAGPEIIESGLVGSRTYEWERRANNQAIERLVYDPFEQNVCWSRQVNGAWKDHGCITAR